MSKKPNAMGRIEGEPKVSKFKTFNWGGLGKTALVIGLVLLGVAGTLQYQQWIRSIKADGVTEYTASKCEKFSDKDKKQTWLECDVVKGE